MKKIISSTMFLFMCFVIFSQSKIPNNTVTINHSQVAYLPIEGIGVHGSYHIKGFASIQNSKEITVSTTGYCSISTNPNFGNIEYFGNCSLIVNSVIIENKKFNPKGVSVILPNDGTKLIGDVKFILPDWVDIKSIEVEIEAGYIHETNATPVPATTKFREKLFEKNLAATLFLFDLSGSMNEAGSSGAPKIIEAQSAARNTLSNMAQNGQGAVVGLTTFSGDCVENPLRPSEVSFTKNLKEVETLVNSLPLPSGSTPLPQAIKASEIRFAKYLGQIGLKQGRLIILSDGQSTCGAIRPDDVYAFGQNGKSVHTVPGNTMGSAGPVAVKYFTIGFNIAPGSAAERDLQYLAQISGGKYLHAQNQFELTRAFQKFSRVYIPKPTPSKSSLPGEIADVFQKGLSFISNEAYADALVKYQEYNVQQADDCNGVYNLALMKEANELYKSAASHYEKYLTLCPDATDKDFVLKQIENLKKDYASYLDFNRLIITSDMAYLDYHFQKIQNGQSIALAKEFIGFINEKWSYYKNLADIIEIDTRPFKINAQEVFRGLNDCVDAIKRDPQNWDRNATPVLSRTYINMERLLTTLK